MWTRACLHQPSDTHHARAESSSGIPSLGGKPSKTPIIAGSVCGGVLLLAWIIGFSIYFKKRYKRKQLKRAAAAIGIPPPEIKSRPQEVIIPPDPAVLLGQHNAGYAFAEGNHTHTLAPKPFAADPVKAITGVGAGQSGVGRGVGASGSECGVRSEPLEERRPLLKVTTDLVLQQRRDPSEESGHGG